MRIKKTRVSSNVGAHKDYSADKSIGLPAPTVHFKDLEGKDASLGDYNGKVVLVNFWATWVRSVQRRNSMADRHATEIRRQRIYGAGHRDG